jgi:hypothetical protein
MQYERTRASSLSIPSPAQVGQVMRGAYLQYERTIANSLSISSPVQAGQEGGERRLPAVPEDQSQVPLHSLFCSGGGVGRW